jgi:hypothetical protein
VLKRGLSLVKLGGTGPSLPMQSVVICLNTASHCAMDGLFLLYSARSSLENKLQISLSPCATT